MKNLALQLTNLSKTYQNGVQAVKSLSLTVIEGDFFALLGPNGAGKTTTIGMITSLVNRTQGRVDIMGHDLDDEPRLAKSVLGVVPQEVNLYLFEKVIDILLYQAAYYGLSHYEGLKRAESVLKKVGLWEKRHQYVKALSGGMKRRLMIARALIHHPKILLLDEPTAGVDIEIRHEMWEHLTSLNQQGLTIILTTHYLEEAEQLCKNIAIIDQGEIVVNSSTQQLLKTLESERFVLYLSHMLKELPSALDYTIDMIDENSLELELQKGESISDVLLQLKEHDIHVERLRNKSNRLEQLFINYINEKHEHQE